MALIYAITALSIAPRFLDTLVCWVRVVD